MVQKTTEHYRIPTPFWEAACREPAFYHWMPAGLQKKGMLEKKAFKSYFEYDFVTVSTEVTSDLSERERLMLSISER